MEQVAQPTGKRKVRKHGIPNYLLPRYYSQEKCCVCDCLCPYSKYNSVVNEDVWKKQDKCIKTVCACCKPCVRFPCFYLCFCYVTQPCECICPQVLFCPLCYWACCQTCPKQMACAWCCHDVDRDCNEGCCNGCQNMPFRCATLCYECCGCACCYEVDNSPPDQPNQQTDPLSPNNPDQPTSPNQPYDPVIQCQPQNQVFEQQVPSNPYQNDEQETQDQERSHHSLFQRKDKVENG